MASSPTRTQLVTPGKSPKSVPSNFELSSAIEATSGGLPSNLLIDGIEKLSIATPITAETNGASQSTSALAQEPQSTDPPKADTSEGHTPELVYRVEYRHKVTDSLVFEHEAKEYLLGRFSPVPNSVLEVITVVLTAVSSDSNKDKSWTLSNPPPTWVVGPTSLKINSSAIIAALQSVVEYYPGQSFLGDSVRIQAPYAILIHHQKELEAYRHDLRKINIDGSADICQRQQDAYNHLGILLDFLRDTIGAEVEAERQRHSRGFATFEMLWLLFKPGVDVYAPNVFERDLLEPSVVQEVNGGMEAGKPTPYSITLWKLDYDGHYIGRYETKLDIDPFDGEKSITSLGVFPCDKLEEDQSTSGKISQRRRLEDQGRMFFRLAEKHCMHYAGLTITYPKRRVKLSLLVLFLM